MHIGSENLGITKHAVSLLGRSAVESAKYLGSNRSAAAIKPLIVHPNLNDARNARKKQKADTEQAD